MKTKLPPPKKEKPKSRTVQIVEPIDDETPELVIPHDEDEEKLSEFLEQFGGKEYKVRVEQFNAAEKVWEHIDTFAVDGFDAYDVCKRYGRGRYRMTFLNERGKYVPGGQPQIRIGGPAASALPAPAAPPVESDPFKHPLVVMMLANAEAQRKESAELIRAIITKPEPQKSSTTEVLDLFVKMEAMRPKADDSTKKMMDAVMGSLIERALNPDKPEAGGLMSEAREGLALLKESGVLSRIGAARQTPPAAPMRVLNAPANPNPPEPAKMPEHPIVTAMRPYISIFKMKAENGVEVEQASSYLIDEAYETLVPLIKKHITGASLVSDETIMENLVARASDPAQIEELMKAAPELEPHRAWVLAVIAKSVETMNTPEAEGQPS